MSHRYIRQSTYLILGQYFSATFDSSLFDLKLYKLFDLLLAFFSSLEILWSKNGKIRVLKSAFCKYRYPFVFVFYSWWRVVPIHAGSNKFYMLLYSTKFNHDFPLEQETRSGTGRPTRAVRSSRLRRLYLPGRENN